MATDVERLVVSLEASITKYERAMSKALQVSNKNMRDIERRTDQAMNRVESRFTQMGRQTQGVFAGVQRAWVGALAGAAAFRGAQALIDASTRIENSLKVTGLAGEELTRVYDSLFASAQRNMAPIETLATLYSRLGLAQSQLGVTNEELLQFTDKVALALRVQGTTAQEARGALIQLSQAMGSGIVRAEEFNSIVEGAPSILRATAMGLEEAGGSVAKLRSLVIEGEVSSQAFFRAFQAGSVILEDQVANAEVTISQQFIRLQNVLIDTAGKFDGAVGATEMLGSALERLASDIDGFGNFLDQHGESVRTFFQAIADGLEAIDRHGGVLADLMGRGEWNAFGYLTNVGEGLQSLALDLGTVEDQITSLTAKLLANENIKFAPGLSGDIQDIIMRLETGALTADEAKVALQELAGQNLDFSLQIGQLAALAGQLAAVRAEANAATAAMPGGPSSRGRPGKEPGQSVVNPDGSPIPPARPAGLGDGSIETVSLADYPVEGGGGSGGSKKKSPTEQFEQALEQQRRRIENLREETALQGTLSPLVNDYGYAMERLKVQQDLLNQAEEAGLELTPERVAAIDEVATAYANAQVEAAKLAEAQEFARDAMQNFADTAESALSGFINDLFEGKSAAESLGNALKNIGTSLLNFGLSTLFGGGLGGIFGFAEGGIARNGKPVPLKKFARGGISNTAAIFGEGPMAEAAVPLPDGRRIPVDLRMPEMPKAGAANQAPIPIEIFVSPTGEFDARVGQIASQRASVIVAQGIKQNNKQLPALMQDMQMRQ